MRRATSRRPAEHVPSSPRDARWPLGAVRGGQRRGGGCGAADVSSLDFFAGGVGGGSELNEVAKNSNAPRASADPFASRFATPSRESARGGPRAIRRRCSASGAWRARASRTSREPGPRRGRSDRPAERSRATPSDPQSPTGRSTSFTSRVPPSAVFSRRKASCTSPIALRARYAIRSGSTEIT